MRGYSRKEVGARLRITDRTVWFYTEQGIVTPEISNPKGKGTTRLYSARNIMEIAVARALADHGLKLELVREILRMGRPIRSKDGFNPWNPEQNVEAQGDRFFLLIYDPTSERPAVVSTRVKAGENVALTNLFLEGNQFDLCIALDLTAIREKVRAALG